MTTRNDDRRPQRPPAKINPLAPGALGLPDEPTTEASDVAEALDHLAGLGVNLLSPLTRIDLIPPNYRLAFRVVVCNCDGYPDGSGWAKVGGKATNGTWYETDGGGLALHKAALRQIAAAAGLSWVTEDLSRTTNRWTVRAIGRIRTMDGAWRTVSAMKDLDLTEDGPIVPTWHAQAADKFKRAKAQGWRNMPPEDASARIMKAREYGNRMAEAKAVNAMIRDALGIRASYSPAQARAPFVFPFLVFIPTSAEAQRLQAAVEYGVVGELYGPSSSSGPAYSADPVIEVEATEPAPRQLPDNGPAPDLQAERRSSQRQPVRRGTPPQEPRRRQAWEDGPPPMPEDSRWNPDTDPDW